MASDKILFIATGGTIEFVAGKTSNVSIGKFQTTYQEPNFRQESLIPEYLAKNYPELEHDFQQICMKDSKDVSVRELLAIESAIKATESRHIIITHGTDTIVENSRMLEKWGVGEEKTIIFVGAFRPLEEGLSDGDASIAIAIKEIHSLDSGVYISGNGKIHKCQEVVKDFDKGEFVGF